MVQSGSISQFLSQPIAAVDFIRGNIEKFVMSSNNNISPTLRSNS